MLITYLPRAELSPHRPQQTFPCTYKHTHQHAHSLADIHTHISCHCSSSTHLWNNGTFTIETSEDLVDKLVGIPLTKEPVKTVCRLMIDCIHHSAGRAEHFLCYTKQWTAMFTEETDSKANIIQYWMYLKSRSFPASVCKISKSLATHESINTGTITRFARLPVPVSLH